MDIKELKQSIESNNITDSFMIWQLTDISSEIISSQYVKEISKRNNLDVKYIESIDEIPDESFIEDNNLYVIKTESWDNPKTHSNCIVICNKTKNKYAIKFPKLEDWQVIDYASTLVKGLNDQELKGFISIYSGNYFRFLNDIDKLSIFDQSIQKMLLSQMLKEGQFDTLSNLTIWDLSNAILRKDIKTIKEVLKSINYIDITPLGLAKVLYNNFKTVTSIQLNPYTTAADVDMSDKQFFVVKKYNCGYYSKEKLVSILEMLTNIEYMFKYGELPLDNLIDYMICNILGD